MKKGNGSTNTFTVIGANNHSFEDRQKEDFYATSPLAAKLLLELESFNKHIWEPACGQGHLSKVFIEAGHIVKSTDLFDRGYGETGIDFLQTENILWNGDIITNPPYKCAKEFILKAISLVAQGCKVAMFLKVQFLEGKSRKAFFLQNPPKVVYVSSSRMFCAKDGEFDREAKLGGSAIAYAWYVWEKGYKGETVLRWFN